LEKIKLTRGKYTIVDDEDYDFLMHFKWCAYIGYNTYYAFNRSAGMMHRLILDIGNSAIRVDHIDGDGLNNQKSNLRSATRSQNSYNREKQYNNTTGYKGLWYDKRGNGLYYVTIGFNGKKYYIGCFKTAIEAAMAYDEAAKELHGDFSNLNFK
jgi:hypothetical protein